MLNFIVSSLPLVQGHSRSVALSRVVLGGREGISVCVCVCVCVCGSTRTRTLSLSVVSDSLRLHGLYTVHGILQAIILEWVSVSFSRGSAQPGDRTQVSHISDGFSTSRATRAYIVINVYKYIRYFNKYIFIYLYLNIKLL